MEHQFVPSRFYNTFGTHPPVLSVNSGDIIHTTTLDSRGCDQNQVQKGRRPNPLTGPFYISGAHPGDVLAVDLLHIAPNRRYGYCGQTVAERIVAPQFVRKLPPQALAEWDVDAEAGTAKLLSPQTALKDLTLTLCPMLGCLGVAPSDGQAISSITSGPYGGNMDYRGLVVGTTAYFPVFVEGGLLYLGDGHAVQGDGEIVGMGIEISMDVTLRVRVIPGWEIAWPRGESDHHIFTMGNARPLDEALQHATTEMLRWLMEKGLDAEAASILLGQCVEYQIGNVFDPAYTVVCLVSKDLLPPNS